MVKITVSVYFIAICSNLLVLIGEKQMICIYINLIGLLSAEVKMDDAAIFSSNNRTFENFTYADDGV